MITVTTIVTSKAALAAAGVLGAAVAVGAVTEGIRAYHRHIHAIRPASPTTLSPGGFVEVAFDNFKAYFRKNGGYLRLRLHGQELECDASLLRQLGAKTMALVLLGFLAQAQPNMTPPQLGNLEQLMDKVSTHLDGSST